MDVDVTILIVTAFIMGMAPFAAVTWIFIAKMGIELFQTADVQAVTEKVNPVLVPGTTSTTSTQTPQTCTTSK